MNKTKIAPGSGKEIPLSRHQLLEVGDEILESMIGGAYHFEEVDASGLIPSQDSVHAAELAAQAELLVRRS